MKSSFRVNVLGALAVALLAMAAGSAHADPHGWRGGPGYYDGRYGHNHYYPPRGYFARGLPPGHIVVNRYNERFFYAGGVWYAPRGPRFVVVGPPLGVFVPVLPPFYTTVWVGGFPYYYANDTYYVWRESQREYEVVSPPDEQSATTTAPAAGNDDVFVYPKNGQSEEQQAQDKYECHRWASSQTGFDPTQSGGGVAPDQNAAKRAEYQRAMGACLEGRGYSVK
jgi:Family of unknown function (DUF6515)